MSTEENVASDAGLAASAPADAPAEEKPKKKRGRPTNAERAARAARLSERRGEGFLASLDGALPLRLSASVRIGHTNDVRAG